MHKRQKKFIETIEYAVIFIVCILIAGCTVDNSEDKPDIQPFEFQIANESQYTVHHVYLHQPTKNYKSSEPLMDNWLEEGAHLSINISPGDYLVTVTRRQNSTGPLLAYTTDSPMYLKEPKKLNYYDDYYRLGDIEVPDEPPEDSVVVGASDQVEGCFISNLPADIF